MKTRYVIAPIVMLAILVACSMPASAYWRDVPLSDHEDSVVWENVTSSALYIGYEGGINPEQYTYHFNVPSGTEVRTQLCTDVWSADDCGQMDFEFNGCGQGCSGDFPFGTYQFGTAGAGCGDTVCDEHPNVAGNGLGGNGVWWNVTDLVTSGATNDFVANRNTTVCTMDGRKRGANLVHLYDKTLSNDTLYVWFNQGMEALPVPDTHIYNVSPDVATEWTLYVCIDTGDNGDTVTFNGDTFTWSAPNHWMDINSYDVTAYVVSGTNTIVWHSSDDYFHPFWTILVGRMPGEVQGPDLTVTEIDAEMLRPGIDQQVNATILNQGDAGTDTTFNVSLEVDGSPYDRVEDIDPLAANANTTVSFTVSLTEGCHNFTVIADCDNNVINESNEDNNVLSENHQVGYVIVVRSNSDFERLNETGDSPLPADCFMNENGIYYIQDLTITNCAGTGITIENTDNPFVIRNCTVHNCRNSDVSGVYFHDLTNGIIDNSTVRDTIGKGIRVKNCTYVNIKDNNIVNNTAYGIEIYPRALGPEEYLCDCQFINIVNNIVSENGLYGIELIGCNCTMRDNIVQDNLDYGIYVFGNDSKIYNNAVENNSDYGMKLFNASGNCICRNDFVNNNNTGVQAYDNRGTNYWNSTVDDIVYKYSGTTYVNYTGNNWSDYTGADNGEGLGSSAYEIDGGAGAEDNYPLIEQRSNYELMCGDVNADGKIRVADGLKVEDVAWHAGEVDSEWAADVNCDGKIRVADGLKVEDVAWHVIPASDLGCCNCCTHYHY